MAYTVIMVTVIFALCSLIALTIMLQTKYAKANRAAFENRVLFDSLGASFYGYVISGGLSPLDVDGWYLYKTEEGFEMVREAEAVYFIYLNRGNGVDTMTVKNTVSKTMLTVSIKMDGETFTVTAWVYGDLQ